MMALTDPPAEGTDWVDRMAEARLAATEDRDSRTPWAVLRRAGWGPETYRRIGLLAERAAAGAGGLVAVPAVLAAGVERSRMFAERLALSAEGAAEDGVPVSVLLPWLVMVAGDTDAERARALLLSVRGWADPADEDVPVARWTEALGPVAALAWAAGLTVEEAETRAAVGTLNEAGLRVLAGLRGYLLPAVE